MADNESGRPWQGGPMLSTAIKCDAIVPLTTPNHPHAEVPRCSVCGHIITSAESIRTGIGRDCRRQLRRLAMGGAA